ncbi:hypothetical protein SH449x_002263 [Pirellulaceae bacterium SH449]
MHLLKLDGSTISTRTYDGYGFTSAGMSYDDEDRLTGYSRASGTFTQAWSLTAVGDGNSITTNGTAQNRTHGPTHELLTAGGQNITTDATNLFGSFALHLNAYTLMLTPYHLLHSPATSANP